MNKIRLRRLLTLLAVVYLNGVFLQDNALGLELVRDSAKKNFDVGSPSEFILPMDSNGKPLSLPQLEAALHCRSLQAQLASARKLALYSIRFGAKGILDTPDCGDFWPCTGVSNIINADGMPDRFLYSRKGYVPHPDFPLGFWSSSEVNGSNSSWFAFIRARDGDFEGRHRSYKAHFVCVR